MKPPRDIAFDRVDFHCHVDLFSDPVRAIAQRERQCVLTLGVTTTPKAWAQNLTWTRETRCVISALGLHPELVGQRETEASLLYDLLSETHFIGEIGLDGSKQHKTTISAQRAIFQRVLTTSNRLGGRVLSIHSRSAASDTIALITQHTEPTRVLPVLHWFSASRRLIEEAVQAGCYFSINHRMLETGTGKDLIARAPMDRLLTESDAPFTLRSKDDDGLADLDLVVRTIAELRRIEHSTSSRAIVDNASRVIAFART